MLLSLCRSGAQRRSAEGQRRVNAKNRKQLQDLSLLMTVLSQMQEIDQSDATMLYEIDKFCWDEIDKIRKEVGS